MESTSYFTILEWKLLGPRVHQKATLVLIGLTWDLSVDLGAPFKLRSGHFHFAWVSTHVPSPTVLPSWLGFLAGPWTELMCSLISTPASGPDPCHFLPDLHDWIVDLTHCLAVSGMIIWTCCYHCPWSGTMGLQPVGASLPSLERGGHRVSWLISVSEQPHSCCSLTARMIFLRKSENETYIN